MTNQDSIQRFSRTAEHYVKYRPTYPQAMLDFLRSECSLNDETVVADIGAGTGRLAQLFLENGFRVFGVEPNDPMRQASQQALKDYTSFTSVKGTAEATTLADQSVDLITAGQAFHWFEPRATRQEFARLLKPGGWLALAWNIPREGSPFLDAYRKLEQSYREKSNPSYLTKETADEKIQAFFAPGRVTVTRFDNAQTFDYTGLKGRMLSSSFAPAPGQPEYEVLLNAMETLFRSYQQDNHVTITYDCMLHYGQLV